MGSIPCSGVGTVPGEWWFVVQSLAPCLILREWALPGSQLLKTRIAIFLTSGRVAQLVERLSKYEKIVDHCC